MSCHVIHVHLHNTTSQQATLSGGAQGYFSAHLWHPRNHAESHLLAYK